MPDEEVTRLQQSRIARLIESDIKIRGECEPEDIPAISETNKLGKSGRTTGPVVVALSFRKPPLYELHYPFVSRNTKNFVCGSCGESQRIVAESEQPRPCEECGRGEARLHNTSWFKWCLCIQEGEKEFAKGGDSVSMIFVKLKKDELKKKAVHVFDGVGLLFGIQQQQQQQQHKLYLHDYNYVVTVLQKL